MVIAGICSDVSNGKTRGYLLGHLPRRAGGGNFRAAAPGNGRGKSIIVIRICVYGVSGHILHQTGEELPHGWVDLKIVMLVGGNALVLSIHPTVGQFLSGLMQDMTGETQTFLRPGAAARKFPPPALRGKCPRRYPRVFPLLTSAPYDPLSPSRIAGDRPRGCRFFEDVRAPRGWAWKSIPNPTTDFSNNGVAFGVYARDLEPNTGDHAFHHPV
jgi:hypothetical protein